MYLLTEWEGGGEAARENMRERERESQNFVTEKPPWEVVNKVLYCIVYFFPFRPPTPAVNKYCTT